MFDFAQDFLVKSLSYGTYLFWNVLFPKTESKI